MKKRSYKQNCSLALASDLLCERWTLLILREFLIQPCRFKQLNLWLSGMGTNLLASRLKELEATKLICKQQSSDKRSAYELTEKGRNTEELVLVFIRWGLSNLAFEKEFVHYPHWDLLAMKALFSTNSIDQKITLQFNAIDLIAWVTVDQNRCEFGMGTKNAHDIELNCNVTQFQQNFTEKHYLKNPLLMKFAQCFRLCGIN
jgi:DNA-binding HxlR family transcriptional regulator